MIRRTRSGASPCIAAVAVAVVGMGLAALVLVHRTPVPPAREGAASETIAAGRAIYAEHCAGCHGAELEGQPDWKRSLPSGRLPAPPHDETGHSWHHPDRVLFEITKHGPAAIVGGGYESDMPPFADILNDDEIRAVLDFIKSTWPERERRYQEELTARDHSRGP